jgi:ATP-binding cassette subfamily F protein uup
MVAQRGHGVQARAADPVAKPTAPRADAAPRAAPPARRRGLNAKEQHELKTLPARMETLTTEAAVLEAKLADAAFYARDPAGFAKATEALATAQAALATAEERWLELEVAREAAGG